MRNLYPNKHERVQMNINIKAIVALFVMLLCTPSLMAQNGKITLKVTDATLESVLKSIEKVGQYKLLYNYDEVSKVKGITFDLKNVPVEEVLKAALTNTNLKFTINNNTIVIVRAIVQQTTIQSLIRVTGTVKTNKGKEMQHVNVSVHGTNRGTITNADGGFAINVPEGNRELVFSFMGYKPKSVILIKGQASVDVIMEEDALAMESIQIQTGYQTLNQREMASSVVQIEQKELDLLGNTSIDQMLAGQVPGMMVLQTSGEPGATPTIRIRGTSSIIGTRAPLWVLDGIILEDPVNVDVTNINSPDAAYLIGNAITGVNPRDIETITVLKDASATAVYGVRAANGVIVVTTKRGQTGPPRISYTGNFTINQRVDYGSLNLMNSGERVKLSQEIVEDNIKFGRVPAGFGYEGLLLDYYNNRISYDEFSNGVQKMANNNTDWYDILFRNSFSHNHSLNLSGGTGKTSYYASLGYNNTPGTAKNSNNEKYNGMVKVSSWVTNKLYIGFKLNASSAKDIGFFSGVNPNKYAYEMSRSLPCYNDDGSLYYYNTLQKSQTAASMAPKEEMLYNVVNEMNFTGAEGNSSAITAQFDLQWNFIKHFSYKLTGGVDNNQTNSINWAKEESNHVGMIRRWNPGKLEIGTKEWDDSPIPVGGIYSNSDQRKNAYTFRHSFEFSKMFEGDHLLSASVTQELRSVGYKGISQTSYGWQPERGMTISPFLTPAYIGVLTSLRPTMTDYVNNNLSWLGIVSYSYADKFTLNGNIRADGSNNFGTNPKYRFMPVWSVAGKYTISNEKFMSAVSAISYLAVRVSYGVQGNIDKSSTPDLIIRVGSKNAKTGLYESFFKYLSNPDLRWEETRSTNVGLDLALFPSKNGKLDLISANIEYYNKAGYQMIVSRKVSQVIGLEQVKVNGGRIRNQGLDIGMSVVPVQSKDFDFSLRFTGSYNKNTLLEANKDVGVSNDDKLAGVALIEGQPLNAFYSYSSAGINPDSGFPMVYNKNGEKRYELYKSETELVYSGVTIPPFSGGFDINFRFKNFYVSAGFLYSNGGVDRLPAVYGSNVYNVFDPLANVSKRYNNRWRNPGDVTDVPALYDSERFRDVNNKYLNDNNIQRPSSSDGSPTTMLTMYDRSSARVASTDNIRMRNLNVSYIFREKFLKPIGVESLSLTFQAQNLFCYAIDKRWEGRDPESGSSNTPLPKVFTFGINIGF